MQTRVLISLSSLLIGYVTLVRNLTCLSLSLLVCKVGIIVVPYVQLCEE